ncbi:hypothetical protein [Phyllobacterium zundukense]|uniref:hypothetical protein n=1 Tax=Phyllobacterium zundukense TaxID=1867719 RepID=UPI003965BB1D
MRLIHPIAAGIGAEEDDLQDPAQFVEGCGATLQGIVELLVQDLKDARQFALLAFREMIKAGFHHG